ncbi:MAG: T9SS type A sorting domain-containing protein [Cyclobacteriaceae bacterium]|nr:T9SS type A sorting domain-containing protein [Cyclobacteriaceae bacterium]
MRNISYYIKKTTIDGCYVVRPVVVEIYPAPNLSITNQNAVCSDTSIDLATVYVDNNATIGTVTYWYDAETTQAIPDPTDIRTSGTYYIKKETENSCIDVEPVEIFITIQPSLVITDPPAVCFPNTVDITNSYHDVNNTDGVISYSYDELGDSVIPDPSQIANSGIYFIHKTLSSGCSNTAPVNVAVNPLPNIIITTPTPICQGEFIDLTTSYTESVGLVGVTTFWLDLAATIPVSTPTAITDSGKFYIQFTSDAGCTDIDSVEIVVGQYPVLELTEPDAVCDGIVVDLKPTTVDVANISGVFSYWKDPDFTDELIDGLVTISGTYYIKKTSVLGCTSSVSVEVVIIKNPLLIISGDTSACSPNTINLADVFTDTNTTTGQVSYWLDEELTNAVAVSTAIDQTGTYYIFKSTVFGSCTDVAPVNINIFQTPDTPTISFKDDTLFSSALHGNQWYLEQDILPEKVNPFLVPIFNGVYYVSQTLNGCKSGLSEGFLSQPTFVNNDFEKIGIEVFPNPVGHFLNIVINNYTGFATLLMADAKGVVWLKKTQQISLSNNKFSVNTAYKNKGENIVIITTETTKYVRKIILR